MDFTAITNVVAYLIYAALASIALWGAFCVIVVWRRVGQSRFRSEQEQSDFLDVLDESLESRKDEFGTTAAQNGLFTKKISFGFFLECGFDDTAARTSDPFRISETDIPGFSCRVLMHG